MEMRIENLEKIGLGRPGEVEEFKGAWHSKDERKGCIDLVHFVVEGNKKYYFSNDDRCPVDSCGRSKMSEKEKARCKRQERGIPTNCCKCGRSFVDPASDRNPEDVTLDFWEQRIGNRC